LVALMEDQVKEATLTILLLLHVVKFSWQLCAAHKKKKIKNKRNVALISYRSIQLSAELLFFWLRHAS